MSLKPELERKAGLLWTGESCLNDAVGIVLYRTMSMFLHRRVTAGSIFVALFSFIGVFLGSVLIGKPSAAWVICLVC
jgi:NhaP-type Na+/H+ or K+/H+ antiporter